MPEPVSGKDEGYSTTKRTTPIIIARTPKPTAKEMKELVKLFYKF